MCKGIDKDSWSKKPGSVQVVVDHSCFLVQLWREFLSLFLQRSSRGGGKQELDSCEDVDSHASKEGRTAMLLVKGGFEKIRDVSNYKRLGERLNRSTS